MSLACAALAVVALGAVCYKVASPEEDKQSVASEESKAPAPTATIWARETVKQPTAKPSATPKATKKAVKTNAKPVTEKLHFSGKLQWPVKGEVLMKYSGDKVVYFKTLAEYRVNESLVIAAKAGTQVKTASRGKVTQIVDSEETGSGRRVQRKLRTVEENPGENRRNRGCRKNAGRNFGSYQVLFTGRR